MEVMSHMLLLLVSVAAAMADPKIRGQHRKGGLAVKALDFGGDPAKEAMALAEEAMKGLENDDHQQKGGLATAAIKGLESDDDHRKGGLAAEVMKDLEKELDKQKGGLAAGPMKGIKTEVDLGKDGSFSAVVAASKSKHDNEKGGSDGNGQDDNVVVVLMPNKKMEGKVDVGGLLKKARASTKALEKLHTQQQTRRGLLKLNEQMQLSDPDEEELKEDRHIMEQLLKSLKHQQKHKADKKHKEELRVRGYFTDATTQKTYVMEAPDWEASATTEPSPTMQSPTMQSPTMQSPTMQSPTMQSSSATTTAAAAVAQEEKEEATTQATAEVSSRRPKEEGGSFSDDPVACPRGQEKGPDGKCDEIWSFKEFKNLGVPPF